MTELLVQLVSHPSRAGEDSCEPVLQAIASWLESRGIAARWLRDASDHVLGLWGEVTGARPGATYVLNAPADTAPFGDRATWNHPPGHATIVDDWLYGRGSADSKAGIAVFCHVIAGIAAQRQNLRGTLGFVFDAEEHSGTFAGIRRFMEVRTSQSIAGVMIGYPGNDRLIVGARGFLRARLVIHGMAAHSGSSSHRGINAIERAHELLRLVTAAPLPGTDDRFPLPPQITLTGIRGGGSFSLVPDQCELEFDLRLTPHFDDAAARAWVENLIMILDARSSAPATTLDWLPGWPAYALAPDNAMVSALTGAARDAFGRDIPPAIAGPSSVANYLATLGISATAGLGVTYRNIHAPDECVHLVTLEPTYLTYLNALRSLLC